MSKEERSSEGKEGVCQKGKNKNEGRKEERGGRKRSEYACWVKEKEEPGRNQEKTVSGSDAMCASAVGEKIKTERQRQRKSETETRK